MLTIIAESGIIGFLKFLLSIINLALKAIKILKNIPDKVSLRLKHWINYLEKKRETEDLVKNYLEWASNLKIGSIKTSANEVNNDRAKNEKINALDLEYRPFFDELLNKTIARIEAINLQKTFKEKHISYEVNTLPELLFKITERPLQHISFVPLIINFPNKLKFAVSIKLGTLATIEKPVSPSVIIGNLRPGVIDPIVAFEEISKGKFIASCRKEENKQKFKHLECNTIAELKEHIDFVLDYLFQEMLIQ